MLLLSVAVILANLKCTYAQLFVKLTLRQKNINLCTDMAVYRSTIKGGKWNARNNGLPSRVQINQPRVVSYHGGSKKRQTPKKRRHDGSKRRQTPQKRRHDGSKRRQTPQKRSPGGVSKTRRKGSSTHFVKPTPGKVATAIAGLRKLLVEHGVPISIVATMSTSALVALAITFMRKQQNEDQPQSTYDNSDKNTIVEETAVSTTGHKNQMITFNNLLQVLVAAGLLKTAFYIKNRFAKARDKQLAAKAREEAAAAEAREEAAAAKAREEAAAANAREEAAAAKAREEAAAANARDEAAAAKAREEAAAAEARDMEEAAMKAEDQVSKKFRAEEKAAAKIAEAKAKADTAQQSRAEAQAILHSLVENKAKTIDIIESAYQTAEMAEKEVEALTKLCNSLLEEQPHYANAALTNEIAVSSAQTAVVAAQSALLAAKSALSAAKSYLLKLDVSRIQKELEKAEKFLSNTQLHIPNATIATAKCMTQITIIKTKLKEKHNKTVLP